MLILDICLSDIPAAARRKAKNDKFYTNMVIDEMKKPDDYGNTHTVYMQQSKEERQAKTPKVYVGKAKEIVFNQTPNTAPQYNPDQDEENDLPF